jgi:peptide/nickel transport system substrate-binding protein
MHLMARTFRRKAATLTVGAAGLIGLVAVACGGGSAPGTEPTAGGTGASAPAAGSSAASAASKSTATEKQVAKITIGFPTDPGSALNLYVSSGYAFDPLLELVYDKLFSPSPYVEEPQPWLAESAKQVDPLTWEVKIRSGVTWHDGTAFTADDVKFTYEYFRDGPQNRHSHHVNDVPKIDRVEKTGESTLVFHCAYACPSLARITFADLPILQKKQWEGVKEPAKMTALPVGTGPYQLIEYTPKQLLRFKANPSYFGGTPQAAELVVPIITDATAIFTALRSGEIDIAARSVPPELIAQFENSKDFKLAHTPSLEFVEMRANYDVAPFKDAAFRRALSLAIDRKALTDTVMLGRGRPGLQGYPHPDSPWTRPGLSTPFNLDEAKAALDRLGYADRDSDGLREMPDGKPLAVSLAVPSNQPLWLRAGELLVKQFAAAGLKVTLKSSDAAVIAQLNRDRAFELQISAIGAHGVADPDQFIMSHRSGYLWRAGVPYPEFDALWEQWKAAATIESRKQVSFKMQELFNQQPTAMPLWYSENYTAYRASAYDNWVETRGYGIIHKWSLLPAAQRADMVLPRGW